MPKIKLAEPIELKDACITAAREVIAEHGIESLSLRDVSRKLGVSHQAPYKHYPSRDHLLAEVMRRCFQEFARHLDGRAHSEDPREDLRALGERYLSFAATHPLEYRLMFGAPWPESAQHPDLVRDAIHAFDILRSILKRVHGSGPDSRATIDQDAVFIWSCMHGVASITQANVMEHLKLQKKVRASAAHHVMDMISVALDARREAPKSKRRP